MWFNTKCVRLVFEVYRSRHPTPELGGVTEVIVGSLNIKPGVAQMERQAYTIERCRMLGHTTVCMTRLMAEKEMDAECWVSGFSSLWEIGRTHGDVSVCVCV